MKAFVAFLVISRRESVAGWVEGSEATGVGGGVSVGAVVEGEGEVVLAARGRGEWRRGGWCGEEGRSVVEVRRCCWEGGVGKSGDVFSLRGGCGER